MILFNSRVGPAFLTNFANCQIVYKGTTYRCVEAAYQAAKIADPTPLQLKEFGEMYGWQAKKAGKLLTLRSDWDTVKQEIMFDILVAKFTQPGFARHLIHTDPHDLCHLSPWDLYWGVDNSGNGQNMLGVMLMDLRSQVKGRY